MRRVAILTKAVKDDEGKVTTPEAVVVPSYDELNDSITSLGVLDKFKKEIGDRSLVSLQVVASSPLGLMS